MPTTDAAQGGYLARAHLGGGGMAMLSTQAPAPAAQQPPTEPLMLLPDPNRRAMEQIVKECTELRARNHRLSRDKRILLDRLLHLHKSGILVSRLLPSNGMSARPQLRVPPLMAPGTVPSQAPAPSTDGATTPTTLSESYALPSAGLGLHPTDNPYLRPAVKMARSLSASTRRSDETQMHRTTSLQPKDSRRASSSMTDDDAGASSISSHLQEPPRTKRKYVRKSQPEPHAFDQKVSPREMGSLITQAQSDKPRDHENVSATLYGPDDMAKSRLPRDITQPSDSGVNGHDRRSIETDMYGFKKIKARQPS